MKLHIKILKEHNLRKDAIGRSQWTTTELGELTDCFNLHSIMREFKDVPLGCYSHFYEGILWETLRNIQEPYSEMEKELAENEKAQIKAFLKEIGSLEPPKDMEAKDLVIYGDIFVFHVY